VLPTLSLGIAGPFIGDKAFADAYQEPYRVASKGTWWQSESVDVKNATRFDDVCESYQVPPTGHELYVQRNAMCAFPVHPLKIPQEAFGIHDLRQYHLFLPGKTARCEQKREKVRRIKRKPRLCRDRGTDKQRARMWKARHNL